jgi:DNA-binding MarR family transcriptional regulator
MHSAPGDKRSRLIQLTPAGLELLSHAVPIWKRTHAAVEERLGDADPDHLRSSLKALS